MACLLQRITSMKLQNNWYVWQISLHLCIIFVPRGTYSCEACTESLHLSWLAATVFASSHYCHPASALSFSTVCLQVVFGLPLLLFLSGAQVTAMFQSLFWSCLSILSNHLPSVLLHLFLIYSSVLTWWVRQISNLFKSLPQNVEMWKLELVFGQQCRCSFGLWCNPPAPPPPAPMPMWTRNVW